MWLFRRRSRAHRSEPAVTDEAAAIPVDGVETVGSSIWRPTLDAIDHRVLPPDRDLMLALGLSHAMPSALADLVDNSLDAGATQVLIRFVQLDAQLHSLLIIDNGRGMDDDAIDKAMTIGRRRDYSDRALGHFGMGLKAASFSQADILTVLSRTNVGNALGRRWMRESASDFVCDVIDPAQATEVMTAHASIVEGHQGTVVRWDRIRTFPAARDAKVTADYLTRTIHNIRVHLGLVLHRLLESGKVTVLIDVLDANTLTSGPAAEVEMINPFGYRTSGQPTYPKILAAAVGERTVEMRCHIWPARSEALGFRMAGSPERSQGFYFYRNDRLVQAGGWNGASVPHRRLQLARVEVDISKALDLFEMSMEKTVVQPKSEFIRAAECSHAQDGTTFAEYLQQAQETYRLGNRRNRSRESVVPPGPGIASEVRNTISHELDTLDDRTPLSIRWRPFDDEDFFEVDRASGTLWLNARYRSGMLSGHRGSLNDLPVVKALLYLLTEDVYRGIAYGPRDRDNVEIWQAVLTAAAKVECGLE